MKEKYIHWWNERKTTEKILLFCCGYLLVFWIFIDPLLKSLQESIFSTQLLVQNQKEQFSLLQQSLQNSPQTSSAHLQTQIDKATALNQTLKDKITLFQSNLPHYLDLLNLLHAQSHTIQHHSNGYTLTLETQMPLFEVLQSLKTMQNFLAISSIQSSDSLCKLTLEVQTTLTLLQPPSDFIIQDSLLSSYDLTPQATLPSHFKLEAIFNQKAKINGIWLTQGQEIQGYMLQKITAKSVVLSKANQSFEIYLRQKRIFQ